MKIHVEMFFMLALCHACVVLQAGTVEKTFYFKDYTIETTGVWQTINFAGTKLNGIPGEPLLPWHEIFLMLPPGESAASLEIIYNDESVIPGKFLLLPKQHVRPVSMEGSGEFLENRTVYQQKGVYPARTQGQLTTQYLDGYALALSVFTPLRYIPCKGQVSFFRKVTVRILTKADAGSQEALNHLSVSGNSLIRNRSVAQNPEMISRYPVMRAPQTSYQYLIISPVSFKNEFQPLISMYNGKGISARVVTTDSISSTMTGHDLQEKMRNFIIGQHQQFNVEYVLLAGNPPLVPFRRLHANVHSGGSIYTDSIPGDLYFSALDGTYDMNGNHKYGEEADSVDLLPDISVGRFTVNDTAELHRMMHKTISYQTNPVLGEMNRPLLAGEFLYNPPLTFGGSYMNLLINDRSDNGYFTHGIPSATNNIEKLYDTVITLSPLNYWSWSASMLLARINQGKSFIHHLGHANTTYMMRLYMSQITNANFAGINGIIHNYQLLYTQGCYCGAFDATGGCIAAKTVTIDNFLAACICNSRYGWFDEGTTEGPSEHLEREFVSALYNDTLPEKHLGAAHTISKIKTAPWIFVQNEFEPGAQRWCHYDCNVFGDPAMEIWTEEPTLFSDATWTGAIDSNWNNPGNWSPAIVPTTLYDLTIAEGNHLPVITTSNTTFCHNLTIQNGGNLTINPGKSMVVSGTVTLAP